MKEDEILQIAGENLAKLTKATIKTDPLDFTDGQNWDGKLEIQFGASTGNFQVEVKTNVLPASISRWAEKLKKPDTLLVAKYISNPAKTILEEQGINFLDIAGNCFIRNNQGIFWQIKGQIFSGANGETKHKAFNKNGIKLIYALLLNENLLNEPYRIIADEANVSVSTVGDILNDLQSAKFVLQLNENKKVLDNKAELLTQWITAFNQKLKPKLLRGRFRLPFENWKQLDIGKFAFWGGEPATDLLTNSLQPGEWTLYTNLDRKTLIKDLQLMPDPKGNVSVCSIFWKSESAFLFNELKTVHHLLVYAELIGSGDDRNFETAQRIYVQFLKNIIE